MKNFVAYVRSILSKRAFLNVFAEEPTNPTNPTPPTDPQPTDPPQTTPTPQPHPTPSGNVNFEELIAKARKEERDKLYPELNKNKEKVNNLLLVVGERDKTIADLTKEVEGLRKDNSKLAEDVKTGNATNQTVSELTTTISMLERQLEDLQVKYESEVNSLKVDSFRKEKIAQAGGQLIPELVTGNTEEEINASIELAKQRYAEITQSALQGVQMPRANPNASATQLKLGDLSADQLSRMSPQEWKEYRKNLGLK